MTRVVGDSAFTPKSDEHVADRREEKTPEKFYDIREEKSKGKKKGKKKIIIAAIALLAVAGIVVGALYVEVRAAKVTWKLLLDLLKKLMKEAEIGRAHV